jgi:hypothetical protein
LLIPVLALLFLGCNNGTDGAYLKAASVVPPVSPTTTPSKSLETTPTPTPTVVIAPTATPTITPTTLANIWSTFTYNNGSPRISIDYPTGWNVEVFWPSDDPDQLIWAKFYPPNAALTENIFFKVYQFDKRLDPRDPPDPMTEVWCPIPWYRPIATKDADGILSLTCPEASSDPRFISMSSYYYSEKHKLEIYISVPPLAVDATILQSPSITDAISKQYGVYEHMVESVRLTEPN